MPIRIVIVDDHKILRDGVRLRLQLEPDFAIVGEAANAAEAYDCVARTAPDVVLMDLNLPGVNGIAATARLRETSPGVRILVLTGEVTAESTHDAILAGAHGFVRKEDASEDLVRAIRVVIGGKTYLS
ncbi:MAG TPA: response regulator transcription factor, partial [Opitutus sp.]|nr:response regulator transcription factor [Opitutus sp.]